MKKDSFLAHVANDLLTIYGTDLSRVAVVFPNKRASLFLNDYLARISRKPVWSPSCLTIKDFFKQQSALEYVDPIKAICDLYKCYIDITGEDETLDHFYGYGQIIASDFDDIDKNLANARSIYRNVASLHELDDISFLTPEQREIITQFFLNFNPSHQTVLKERFIKLWGRMADIYDAYRKRLQEQGRAYEGMLYRDAVEKAELRLDYDHYAFVGFNLLQKAEEKLFRYFKQTGKARFYWDYDHYYLDNPLNEAGEYMRRHLEHFPNALQDSGNVLFRQLDNKEHPKTVSYISASTETMQARYISTWLQENNQERQKAGSRTAIVLCDERLLPAAIHSLPENTLANITTGYPLAQTPVAALIAKTTTKWKGTSADKEKTRRLFETLLTTIKELNAPLSSPEGDTDVFAAKEASLWEGEGLSSLLIESAFRAYTAVNRIYSLVESGDLTVDLPTLSALIRQVIGQTTIPFHGEPVKGVQIMGMLETRNLDFDHLLILSCGEGNMPKGMNHTSMVPYNIRRAHELMTSDNRAAVYAYHFYRLLSRAGDITITYNNATTDGQTGQQSRFMMQLLTESHHPIRHYQLTGGQLPMTTRPIALPSPSGRNGEEVRLSPSAINHYLRCQLRFYYAHVQHIREPQTDDPTDNRIFGNIFHRAAELAYQSLAPNGGEVTPTAITDLLANEVQIERFVGQAVKEEREKNSTPKEIREELLGHLLIIKAAAKRYLCQLLETDATLAPFHIIGLEIEVEEPTLNHSPREGSIYCSSKSSANQTPLPWGGAGGGFHGFIDRLDLIRTADGKQRIRVVDYKTGHAPAQAIKELEQVFSPKGIDKCHGDYYLQAMLYSLIVSRSEKLNPNRLPVSPALLFIRNVRKDDYDPTLAIGGEPITDIEVYRQPFETELNSVLRQIYTEEAVFEPTGYPARCPECPYRTLCFTPSDNH